MDLIGLQKGQVSSSLLFCLTSSPTHKIQCQRVWWGQVPHAQPTQSVLSSISSNGTIGLSEPGPCSHAQHRQASSHQDHTFPESTLSSASLSHYSPAVGDFPARAVQTRSGMALYRPSFFPWDPCAVAAQSWQKVPGASELILDFAGAS